MPYTNIEIKQLEIDTDSKGESKIPYYLEEYGVVLLRNLLKEKERNELLESFALLRKKNIPLSQEILYTNTPPEANSPGLTTLMDQWLNPHQQIQNLFESSICLLSRKVSQWCNSQKIFLFQSLLTSRTKTHRPFPWHQDYPFWPTDRPEGLVLWLALDPVDYQSGGLEIALKSNQTGIGPAIDLYYGSPQEQSKKNDIPSFQDSCLFAPKCEAGDAVLFHPLAWHRSTTNQTESLRRVWITSWLTERVCWSKKNAPRHPLCKTIEEGKFVVD